MRVELDQSKCVSSGQCVFAAPEIFDQRDEDGVGFVLDDQPQPSARPDVANAVQLCPSLAIKLVEEPDA